MAGPSSVYRLNYSRKRITDDNVHHLRRELHRQAERDNYPYEEVDFSQNELGSGGLHVVLELCRRCPRLRVLKLYKNQIDDGGAEGLAELCRQCPSIEEMHLSHNHFTAMGVEVLITAAEQARSCHVSPLWLRLEQNDVHDPEAVFRDLQSRLSVCNRMDEVRCTVRVCSKKQKVHLPFFHLQRANRMRDSAPAASLYGGAPTYRVPRDEASPAYNPGQSATAKHGNPGTRLPASANAPSRSLVNTPKSGLATPNGTTCAWDVNGANAARRFIAQSAATSGVASATTPAAGNTDGRETPNGTTCAWDVNGVNAARRFIARSAATSGLASATTPAAGNTDGREEAPRADGPSAVTTKKATPPPPPPVAPAVSAAAASATAVAPTATPASSPAAQAGAAAAGTTPTAAGGQGWPPDEGTTPSELQKREGGSDNVDAQPTPARQRKAPEEQQQPPAQPGSRRASLVLDKQGRRRILPKQLEGDGANMQFVCPLCTFVIIRPLITSCSHLFCDTCFRNWVNDQVSKQKKGMPGDGPVPLIQCPQPKCTAKLRKRDIMPMDQADATKVGATVQLLQRMRNNLQIRCVHHSDHFKYSFGQDAERVKGETGLTCKWIGDLAAYEEHVRKNCPVEQHLGGPPAGCGLENGCSPSASPTQSSAAPLGGGSPKNPLNASASPLAAAESGQSREAQAASVGTQPAPAARSGGAGGDAAEAAAQKAEPAAEDSSQGTRLVRYDYAPGETDKAQIPLKQNDLVRIFEVTQSGWAAGVRLCRKTGQEVGMAGWFPATYLYPRDHLDTTNTA